MLSKIRAARLANCRLCSGSWEVHAAAKLPRIVTGLVVAVHRRR